jgi:CBS domain-containing protein
MPMKAQDIMTKAVVTVRPDTSIRDIASLMVEKHISGIPVVNEDGKMVGIVSQSDLLHRTEVGTERKHKWWFRIIADSQDMAREYAKAHGLRASDVMARYVISVRPDAELSDVADILDNNKIKRVPVVDGDKLVGLITRGDLVRALSLSHLAKSATPKKVENAALHKTLQQRIRAQPWLGADQDHINLTVSDGTVEIWGYIESVDQHKALRVLVEETEGVGKVIDKMMVGMPSRAGQRLV